MLQNYILFYDGKDLLAYQEDETLSPALINDFFLNQDEKNFMTPKKDHITLVEDILLASQVDGKDTLLRSIDLNKSAEIRLFKPKI